MDLWRTPTSIFLLLFLICLSPTLSPTPSVALAQEVPTYHQNLMSWSRLMHQATAAPGADDHAASDDHVTHQLRALLDLTSSQWRDVIEEAVLLSASGDDVSAPPQNVTSAVCLNHTLTVLAGIAARDTWALRMVDAMGKPSFGILDGNVNWPGGYTECRNVRSNTTVVSPQFSGRYCSLYSTAPSMVNPVAPQVSITLGACVPASCSSEDITLILNMVARTLNLTSQINPVAVCQETRSLDAKAVVAIVICSILLCLMVAGTALDLLFLQRPRWADRKGHQENDHSQLHHNVDAMRNPEQQPLLPEPSTTSVATIPELGVLGKTLVAFSVYTNGRKLLDSSQSAGSLTCIHGIRFLSMTWVVLGHTWISVGNVAMNALPYLKKVSSDWSYQCILNATVSVDSFFLLSGLLVSYLTLKEMKKRDGKLNWFLFYFHRFWRLTPAYMLCLMVATCLLPHWGEGPFWPAKFPDEDNCAKYWWTNLLYINNFWKAEKECFAVSWYLSNDMQFYILSPLIFVPLFFFPVVGCVVSALFLLATSITPGVLSQQYGLPPGLIQAVQGGNQTQTFSDYFEVYYVKPYNRMGVYVIGMLAGYFLYRTNCKLRIHWVVNLCLWAVATACALAVLYGLFEATNGHPVTVPVAAFYNAVARQVWGACVAWVVVACVTGNGGFVNTILSWPALVPLSRLTYCIYLLHLTVLEVSFGNFRTVFFMDDLNLICQFLGILVTSTAVAFVASLAFEAPMMGLEKAFLRPKASTSDAKH